MSFARSLSELKSEQEFSQITLTSSSKSVDPASLSAIWSTLSLLLRNGAPTQLRFLPSHLSLVVSSSQEIGPISSPEANFLEDLTRTAHVTGASLACSSVLAGLTSESDEFGDVGILLPSASVRGNISEEDKEKQILTLLGLQDWLESGGRIIRSEASSSGLPSGLAQIPQTQRAAAQGHLDALTSLLSKLEHRFEFRLEGGENKGGSVIWFLLGQLTLNQEGAWVGLIGAGTWGES